MKKALLYSGGVESTLLYFLLLKENNTALNLFIVDRYNNPIPKAISLYNKLKESWGDTNSTCSVIDTDINLSNTQRIKYAIKEISKTHNTIVWGMNAYPDNIRPKLKESTMTHPGKVLSNNPKLKMPFIDYTKDIIIKMYYDNNIHHVLEDTHSCGEPVGTPCGSCFNCREREWAYNKLNLPLHRGR